MLTKNDLFTALVNQLELHSVEESEEIADSVVDKLDEDGIFNDEDEE